MGKRVTGGKTRAGGVALALGGALLSACSDDGRLVGESGAPSFRVAPPPLTRAVPVEDLVARVTVDGDVVGLDVPSGRQVTFTRPPDTEIEIEVRWSVDGLLVWRAVERRRVTADTTVVIDDYASAGEGLDRDDDGFSNLEELGCDSDPADPASVPVDCDDDDDDTTVEPPPPIDPGGGSGTPLALINRVPDGMAPPLVDGLYVDPGDDFTDSVWNRATFVDEAGEQLDIDNLLRRENAGPLTENPDYRWYALHDDENLYLFVEGKVAGVPISFDDRIVFFDDNLNVHIDADLSGGDAYDGVDDYHFGLALADADGGPNTDAGRKATGLSSVDEPFPESIRFATCFCTPVNSWEVAIPLAAVGIRADRTFGIELQIDEDNANDNVDARDRDAKFGWANPSFVDIGGTDSDFAFLRPSAFGRARLR